jgi:hypothetical protein
MIEFGRRNAAYDKLRRVEVGKKEQKTRCQMTDDGGQVTEVRGQMTEMPFAGKNTNEHRTSSVQHRTSK